MTAAVYVQTNDAVKNEIVGFSRSEDGALAPLGRYETGGRGFADRVRSGGSAPTSVTVHGDTVSGPGKIAPVSGSVADSRNEVCWAAVTQDGRFAYVTAIDADAKKLYGWTVGGDGRRSPVGAFEGVPETVAGLAAS